PARGEIQDRVMKPDAPIIIAADRIDMRAKMQVADGKPGLLRQLTPSRRLTGFPQILSAPRQCPASHTGRFAPAAQQDMVVLDHHDADTDERPARILAVAHGFDPSSLGGGAFKSSSDGSSD